mmetsp:Transcript_8407/g.25236  ORF Transcript_8407/g.25236 Transcript_8407/m.25236 type:complete len:178 (-) Transcript_8407:3148-3681(-)
MELIPVTSIYAGLLGLLSLFLSVRVVTLRRKTRCLYGVTEAKGEDGALLEALSRSHGNFCEYAWGGLLLLALAEVGGAGSPWLLHLIGATLTVGRVLYSVASSVPISELKVKGNPRVYTRIHGMTLTYAGTLPTCLLLLHAPQLVALGGWALFVALGALTGPTRSPIDASRRKGERD